MLFIPQDGDRTAKVLSIDPGSDTTGVALFNVDVITHRIVSSDAWTLCGSKHMDRWVVDLHTERMARLLYLKESLLQLFNQHDPFMVVSESPFYNRRTPSAYGSLTEIISLIREMLWVHDRWKTLYLVDPMSVKQSVGASRHAKKDEVKEKVLGLTDLCYQGSVPLSMLDEHSYDALAVGYGHIKLHL